MGRYMIRRLLQFIPVFLGATFLIFALVFLIPGDPIRALSGDKPMPPSVHAALEERYNLNKPFWQQYTLYVTGVVQGDFGEDFRGRQVVDIMRERIPVTFKLAMYAFAFEIVIGLTAGVMAGLRKGGFVDNLVRVSTLVVISIPIFVLGFMAQLLIGVRLGWLPVSGLGAGTSSFIMPAIVLGSLSLAYIARLTRTSLAENMRADYVRTATAKGLKRSRVVGVHAMRNSMIPVITFLGVDLGALMGGAIITEGIFNLPGLGNAVFTAVTRQEGTVVVGIVTFLVLLFLLSNLIVDVLYAVLDPRIRYE
ncbi:MAG TPA: ABC transporter permease [Acidimicrobiia bacterium]|nr:ABC transporter permease [Acidimicrobiia bacterium]